MRTLCYKEYIVCVVEHVGMRLNVCVLLFANTTEGNLQRLRLRPSLQIVLTFVSSWCKRPHTAQHISNNVTRKVNAYGLYNNWRKKKEDTHTHKCTNIVRIKLWTISESPFENLPQSVACAKSQSWHPTTFWMRLRTPFVHRRTARIRNIVCVCLCVCLCVWCKSCTQYNHAIKATLGLRRLRMLCCSRICTCVTSGCYTCCIVCCILSVCDVCCVVVCVCVCVWVWRYTKRNLIDGDFSCVAFAVALAACVSTPIIFTRVVTPQGGAKYRHIAV